MTAILKRLKKNIWMRLDRRNCRRVEIHYDRFGPRSKFTRYTKRDPQQLGVGSLYDLCSHVMWSGIGNLFGMPQGHYRPIWTPSALNSKVEGWFWCEVGIYSSHRVNTKNPSYYVREIIGPAIILAREPRGLFIKSKAMWTGRLPFKLGEKYPAPKNWGAGMD